MAEGGLAITEWGRLESAIISGLRHLRDRYLQRSRVWGEQNRDVTERELSSDSSDLNLTSLCGLPTDMQLYIISFLSPQDVCQLGMTNHYWHLMVQDRLLWRYFLLRDLPTWSSIEWQNVPDLDVLTSCFSESPDKKPYDYMSIYLKNCPKNRRSLRSKHPIYGAVTSFLQSLVIHTEPRFAMFGPGLEQLDDSLVTRMMTSPDLIPVVSIVQRQIDGIGSGVTFQLDSQHKFNILTLYSTTRTQRKQARIEQTATVNKMFMGNNPGENEALVFTLIPQVKEVCKVVDGFIYVANAESWKRHNREEEVAQISAMTDPSLGSKRRPMLVLSCVTHPGNKRIPSVYMAHELCLNRLNRPWLVQNTEASTLSGLHEGIVWIFSEVGRKM
ncbi:F-box only protein 4 [Bombina bombina]|uniref:F-box only protein 4 n=1 Tax=Bombina bombina TaxID=8345 RepID=UPI00235AABBC|nr:F-box only protein 4 [Bombina bombina]